MSFTVNQKLACVEREVRQRKRVYPRLIMTHRLSEAKAAYELQVMEAIVEDYRALAEEERLL